MARYNDLVNELRAHVNQAAVPEIVDNIRLATITFCRRSRFWRSPMRVNLEPGKASYDLRVTGGRSDQILRALYQDDSGRRHELKKAMHQDVQAPARNSASDHPMYYSEPPGNGAILVFPAPSTPADKNPHLDLYVVAVPTRNSNVFPDFIYEEWHDAIIHGTLWYMLKMPNKPWTNHARSSQERFEFFTAINNARREAMTDSWAPQRTTMRKWV